MRNVSCTLYIELNKYSRIFFDRCQYCQFYVREEWKESILSGEALAGEATTGTYGEINSSALEQANVNLTTELIDMIIAQRNFQANSRALEVNNSLNQTILNIR